MAGDGAIPARGAGSWMVVGIAFSAMNGAYQCLTARLISSLFPLHVAPLIPLMLGLSIASAGAGALLARKLGPRLGAVGLFAGVSMVAATAAQVGLANAAPWFWFTEAAIAAVATTIPAFAAIGAVTAACFGGLCASAPTRIPRFVALEGAAFVAAYTGAAFAVGSIGIAGPLLATAAGGLVAMVRRGRGAVLLGAVMLVLLPVDAGDGVFDAVRPPLRLWEGFTAAERLGGGWSPYARVDFVRSAHGLIAGVYNGAQQWAVDPESKRDLDVRRHVYGRIGGTVLMVGTGGGQGVPLLGAGAGRVIAVELDPLVVELAATRLAGPLGDPYRRAEVVSGDGRAFLDRSRDRFDVIIYEGADLNVAHRERELIGMESYLYTNEGIAAAFDRLEENGSLLFFLSAGQDFARRIAAGFDPASHAVAYEGHAEGIISFRYQLVVASRSERAVAEWREYLEAGGLRIERFRLDGPGAEEPRAASDDSPFVYRPIPFVVPVLSSSIALLALALVALVLRSPSRREAAYFGLVGVAFVFSEMNALVASRAALGGYYTTSAMVFALIALGYAGGALLSARLGRPAIAGITVFAFGLAALSSLCSAGVSGGVEAVVVLVAKTLPLGVAMGCYLPRGLARALAHRVPSMVAADILGGAIGTLAYYLVVFRLGTHVAWLGGAGLYLSALALL